MSSENLVLRLGQKLEGPMRCYHGWLIKMMSMRKQYTMSFMQTFLFPSSNKPSITRNEAS